jgi:rhodanese-related sulfurtransferase
MQDLTVFLQHHSILSLSVVILLLLLALVEFIRLKLGAARLTPQQLTQLINHQHAVVVDLRPAEQFAKGHIIDALSVPASEFKEKSKKIEKLKTRPIVLVCTKGLESPKIAANLKNRGFKVHILGGGISSWTNADLPLIKE